MIEKNVYNQDFFYCTQSNNNTNNNISMHGSNTIKFSMLLITIHGYINQHKFGELKRLKRNIFSLTLYLRIKMLCLNI